MKQCPSCGASNADNARFCTGCGNPLPTFAPSPSQNNGSNSNTTLVIVLAVILGAVIIAAAVFFGLKSDNNNNQNPAVVVEVPSQPVAVPTVQNNQVSSRPGQYSWLSERRVTYDDIAGLSKAERRILRNAIYAMHGRKFKSADLQQYFSQYSWYVPVNTEVYDLNKIEEYNVKFIQQYE